MIIFAEANKKGDNDGSANDDDGDDEDSQS